MTIETRIRAAIDRVREQSSSIPDIDQLFVSLKSGFPEIGIVNDNAEGERACIALMLLTLKMLMPECKTIMETFAKKRNSKTANAAPKESRVISLHRAVDGTWKHRLFDDFSCEPAWRRGPTLSRRWRASPIRRASSI
jgi:hypothetical protein